MTYFANRSHLGYVRSSLNDEGYSVSIYNTSELRIKTAGWNYSLTVSKAGCSIQPGNNSKSYALLCDRVRHHLFEFALQTNTAAIPMASGLPWRSVILWEPWATLIAMGMKTWETRPSGISWRNYRGVLLIQAAQTWHPEGKKLMHKLNDMGYRLNLSDLAFGKIVAFSHMTGTFPAVEIAPTVSDQERLCGNWTEKHLAIQLDHIHALDRPILGPTGNRGLSVVRAPLQAEVLKEIEEIPLVI